MVGGVIYISPDVCLFELHFPVGLFRISLHDDTDQSHRIGYDALGAFFSADIELD